MLIISSETLLTHRMMTIYTRHVIKHNITANNAIKINDIKNIVKYFWIGNKRCIEPLIIINNNALFISNRFNRILTIKILKISCNIRIGDLIDNVEKNFIMKKITHDNTI